MFRLTLTLFLFLSAAFFCLPPTIAVDADNSHDDSPALINSGELTEEKRSRMIDDLHKRYSKWLRHASPSTAKQFTAAIELKAKRDLNGALVQLDKLIIADPGFAPAYAQRAGIQARRRQYVAALGDCNKALSLKIDDDRVLRNRMYCNLELKHYQEGIKDATES